LGLGRGAVAFPQYGVLGYAQNFFSKLNVKIEYFSAFLQAKMVSSVVASRQD